MTHKSTEIGYHPEMILAGRRINDSMGKHIANCTILEMTKLKINPVGAKIGILGLTFKENCPDLRNTKVPDIINYLNKFGLEIFVSDPYADKEQAKQLYNINLINAKKLTEMDAIILAVAHEDFTLMLKDEWAKIMNSNSILMDVKSVYPKNYFNNSKIVHWRL
jgi:UDP-N-acetyl-D-galactosamine dehydrogenase